MTAKPSNFRWSVTLQIGDASGRKRVHLEVSGAVDEDEALERAYQVLAAATPVIVERCGTEVRGCEAVQVSDAMRCERCRLMWDVNDPDPPKCMKEKMRG